MGGDEAFQYDGRPHVYEKAGGSEGEKRRGEHFDAAHEDGVAEGKQRDSGEGKRLGETGS